MQTAPLSLAQWRACVMVGVLSIPVGYLLKLIPASLIELRAIAPQPVETVPSESLKGSEISTTELSQSPVQNSADANDESGSPGGRNMRKRPSRA